MVSKLKNPALTGSKVRDTLSLAGLGTILLGNGQDLCFSHRFGLGSCQLIWFDSRIFRIIPFTVGTRRGLKCLHCGAVDIADSGVCGVCGRDLRGDDYAISSKPVSHSNPRRGLRYAGLIGLGELIAITFATWLSNSQSVPLQVGLFETAILLLLMGALGFLYTGPVGMLQFRWGKPWNPDYAQDVARTIREDQPSRFGATLVLLLLGALTLAIAFLL